MEKRKAMFLKRMPVGLMIAIGLMCHWAKAQTPTWENPVGYQHSMTVTGVLIIDGAESRDTNDKVAAFIDDEVAGVENLIYAVGPDRYFVALQIFSESGTTSPVQFRYYDASEDAIGTIDETINYVNESDVGSFSEPLLIKNNLPPLDISVSTTDVMENSITGSTLLSFSTSDPDASDDFAYSLVSGTGDDDNGSFEIQSNELLAQTNIDFESQSHYQIRVRSTDLKGEFVEKTFELAVQDANDTPTAISLLISEVQENTNTGTVLATPSVSDEDTADSHTLTLVIGDGDTHNDWFVIEDNQLKVAGLIDYENNPKLHFRLRATDAGGRFIEQGFVLEVLDTNDTPTAIYLSSKQVKENLTKDVLVATLTTEDQDAHSWFSYTLVAGFGHNEDFYIQEDRLYTRTSFNFESGSELLLRIRSQDNTGLVVEETFTLEVIDQNEPPVIADQYFEVAENEAVGYLLGTLEASDIDEGDALSFGWAEPVVGFELSANGEVTLANADWLDYEVKQLYTFDVYVKDSNEIVQYDTASLTIAVVDVVEQKLLPYSNLMTPNGDGKNDSFLIQNVELYGEFELTIFGSDGNEVYKTTGYDNGWYGTDRSGNELRTGTYFFYLVQTTGHISYSGTIQLIR